MEDRQTFIIPGEILLNQLRRNSPKIAGSFDLLFGQQLEEISAEFARIATVLWDGKVKTAKEEDNLRGTCATLTLNTLHTIMGAIELLRNGYRLQPGILLRNALESISTLAYLFKEPEALDRFRAGKLQSRQTRRLMMGKAKSVVPVLEELWGRMSNSFAHPGDLYLETHPLTPYLDSKESAVWLNIANIKIATFLLSVVAELIFFEAVTSHRFWSSPRPGEYMYHFNEEGRQFYNDFLLDVQREYERS